MPSPQNTEKNTEGDEALLKFGPMPGQLQDPSQHELGIRWIEPENPIRFWGEVVSPESEVAPGSTPRSVGPRKAEKAEGRQEIYQILRNESAPTAEEKVFMRPIALPSDQLLWQAGLGNWLPDDQHPIIENRQEAIAYVERERELYRKKLGDDPDRIAS